MAFNTGNPVGSIDPRDLIDNAPILDEWVNSTDKLSHPDRLGVERKTLHGMESEHDSAQLQRSGEFDSSQAQRADAFDADQTDRSDRFDTFMDGSAYFGTGPNGEYEAYAAGITFSERNQVIYAAGEAWKPASETVLPYTTTGAGMPESGAFVAVGDAVLRQDLADPAQGGAAMVAYGDKTVAAELDKNRMNFGIANGSYSWWTYPVAKRFAGKHDRTYIGNTKSDTRQPRGGQARLGSTWLTQFDHSTRELHEVLIYDDTVRVDDHNAASVAVDAAGLAVFVPGRNVPFGQDILYYRVASAPEDITTLSELKSLPTLGRSNYPQSHISGSDFLLTYNVSDGNVRKWTSRLNTWPITEEGWTEERIWFADGGSYITVRDDGDKTWFAVGFHPTSTSRYEIYAGYIDKASSPKWNICSVEGVVLGNLTNGSGLPVARESLTPVYTNPTRIDSRLFDIAPGPRVAYCQFVDGAGRYKVAEWNGTGFDTQDFGPSGAPFLPVSLYVGGVGLDEKDPDHLMICREHEGTWTVEDWRRTSGTWSGAVVTESPGVLARPLNINNASEEFDYLWFDSAIYRDYDNWDGYIATRLLKRRAMLPQARLLQVGVGNVAPIRPAIIYNVPDAVAPIGGEGIVAKAIGPENNSWGYILLAKAQLNQNVAGTLLTAADASASQIWRWATTHIRVRSVSGDVQAACHGEAGAGIVVSLVTLTYSGEEWLAVQANAPQAFRYAAFTGRVSNVTEQLVKVDPALVSNVAPYTQAAEFFGRPGDQIGNNIAMHSGNVATSILSAPAFPGQLAIVGGVGYIGTGTASASDWKQITI